MQREQAHIQACEHADALGNVDERQLLRRRDDHCRAEPYSLRIQSMHSELDLPGVTMSASMQAPVPPDHSKLCLPHDTSLSAGRNFFGLLTHACPAQIVVTSAAGSVDTPPLVLNTA